MKGWRALEEKREAAWEMYMGMGSSDNEEDSITNEKSLESIGIN
jgi:hypothetical protein